MDAAACIGCGACVAACPNASASLFTGAKITHLGVLPQGQPERRERVIRMVAQANAEGFGYCTNIGECEAVCPKEIRRARKSRLHRRELGAAGALSQRCAHSGAAGWRAEIVSPERRGRARLRSPAPACGTARLRRK